ncbi:MAG: hypothetical protein AAGF31_10535 [Planctomycetota bacterium]
MPCLPTLSDFAQQAAGADYVPVYRRLVSDTLTPVTGFHHLDSGSVACLFESVIGGEKVGRYSFVASDPYLLIEAYERRVTMTKYARDGGSATETETIECDNPLELLRERVAAVRVAHAPHLPPLCRGRRGLRRVRHGPLRRAPPERP